MSGSPGGPAAGAAPAAATPTTMVCADNLVKIYKSADVEVVALQGLDLAVPTGEVMAIIGNSGSGKSTLLNIIGGLDIPSAGRIEVAGVDLAKLTEHGLVHYRRRTVGFVWQNVARNLVPYLSALQNVQIPMLLARSADRRARAVELLQLLGLSHRMHARLAELSGGEQQRVAIAIGMANLPRLLLADEPTGNVDSKTAAAIFQAFRAMNASYGVTVIVVTHNRAIARAVDRVVAIRDGRTSSELVRTAVRAEDLARIGSIAEALASETHEEFAVLDRAGRLQLPREHLEALGLLGQSRIKVELEADRIVLRRPRRDAQPKDAGGGS